MVAARQRDDRGVVRPRLIHLVDRHVEIEEQRAMRVLAHHALDPDLLPRATKDELCTTLDHESAEFRKFLLLELKSLLLSLENLVLAL